jgi:riboflavin biosynthesis pyrimidine reductase
VHGVTVVGVPGDAPLAPAAVVDALRAHGFARIVCEGGPTLASQFAGAGVIDEYCVTVAPAIEPAEHPFVRVDAASRPATDVAGMLVDAEGFSYLRLRRRA